MRDDHFMSNAAQRLIDEFESLPESDQKAVAAEILRRAVGSGSPASLDAKVAEEDTLDDLTDEQREVIDRRLAEHARNPDSAIPWEEGRMRLYRRFA
jgi:putative addiction module component (TIGR02574 family)